MRSRRPEVAATTPDRLAGRTRASNTDWALGIEARSRALLTDGPAAEALYEEALERLSHGRVALHLARARLVYGEWLRRENRRLDARRQLGAAHDRLDGFGATAFAERVRRELLATGETARRRTADAQVVVGLANGPDFSDAAILRFFQTSEGNLLKAEVNAGVAHHVALTIVGADRGCPTADICGPRSRRKS